MTAYHVTLISRECTDLGTDSGSGPIWVNRIGSRSSEESVTDLALIRRSADFRSSALLFILSNAATAHSHRWHKAVISLGRRRRLLCNVPRPGGPRPTPHMQRVGVFQREVLQ